MSGDGASHEAQKMGEPGTSGSEARKVYSSLCFSSLNSDSVLPSYFQ